MPSATSTPRSWPSRTARTPVSPEGGRVAEASAPQTSARSTAPGTPRRSSGLSEHMPHAIELHGTRSGGPAPSAVQAPPSRTSATTACTGTHPRSSRATGSPRSGSSCCTALHSGVPALRAPRRHRRHPGSRQRAPGHREDLQEPPEHRHPDRQLHGCTLRCFEVLGATQASSHRPQLTSARVGSPRRFSATTGAPTARPPSSTASHPGVPREAPGDPGSARPGVEALRAIAP